MFNWFHIQLLKKGRETRAEGHRGRKLFQGKFLMESILQENCNFPKDMHGGKQFPFPPPIQVSKQKMVKPRSTLFLSSASALLSREGKRLS